MGGSAFPRAVPTFTAQDRQSQAGSPAASVRRVCGWRWRPRRCARASPRPRQLWLLEPESVRSTKAVTTSRAYYPSLSSNSTSRNSSSGSSSVDFRSQRAERRSLVAECGMPE